MHQCNTQGFPSNLHDIKLTRPEGESHTTFCPCSCKRGLPKKSAGSYQTQPRLPYEPIAASHSGSTTNQTAKWHHRKSLLLSVGPLHQNWFTPPKNRVFFHGWFEEAQVCYVFRANGPWASGNSGNHQPTESNGGKNDNLSMPHYASV